MLHLKSIQEVRHYFKFLLFNCVYANVSNLNFKNDPQGGCATSPNVPKLSVSGVKDTAKTNKDLGMSCYRQVRYSVLLLRFYSTL